MTMTAAQGDAIVNTLRAVVHQMEHGEASDVFDRPAALTADSIRDIAWCRDQLKAALAAIDNPLIRYMEWGHWGLLFYEAHAGDYAPTIIHGRINFPVGAAGPCDGFIGSQERKRYEAMSQAWIRDGVLPDGLVR